MDNATLIATLAGGILSGGFITAIGAAIVSNRKSRTDTEIAEMNAKTEDELKRRKNVIDEWIAVHERDEAEKKEIKAEVTELRKRVDEIQRSETECRERCARMEEQLKMFRKLLEEKGIRFDSNSP